MRESDYIRINTSLMNFNHYNTLLKQILSSNDDAFLSQLQFYIGIGAYNLTAKQKKDLKNKIEKVRLLK
jgi:hypothetical protein